MSGQRSRRRGASVLPNDARSLIRTGTITKSDLLDKRVYILADGSEQRSQRFRIRSLRVDNLELHDVVGSVAPSARSLLLGQSFLERFKYWTIDNQRHLLIINEQPTSVFSAPAPPPAPTPVPTYTPVPAPAPAPAYTPPPSIQLQIRDANASSRLKLGLNLPTGWHYRAPTQEEINVGISVSVQNASADIFAVLSEFNFAKDFNTTEWVHEDWERHRAADVQSSLISELEINGRHAYRYSLTVSYRPDQDKPWFLRKLWGNRKPIRYLYTYIVGRSEIALLNTWTEASKYDQHKAEMEALAENVIGFQ
jgi:hypothetical protein